MQYLLTLWILILLHASSVFAKISDSTFESTKDSLNLKISEASLLQRSDFQSFFKNGVSDEMIKETGATGRNKKKFVEISSQRAGLKLIQKGIATNNQHLVHRGLSALEYGFEFQNKDGSFSYAKSLKWRGVSESDILEAQAFFMDAVGHSYLLIYHSDHYEAFQGRLFKLNEQILRSLHYLSLHKQALFSKAKAAPNRLLFSAIAFKLGSMAINSPDFENIGESFLLRNLLMQRSDGTFDEHGGYDSSYQAVNLLKLLIYRMYSDNPSINAKIDSAIKIGMGWETKRIMSNGKIIVQGNSRTGLRQENLNGKFKEVNYYEVALCFMFHGEIYNNPRSTELGLKIVHFALQKSSRSHPRKIR